MLSVFGREAIVTDDSCNAEDPNSGEISQKKIFHTLVSNILSHGK